MNLYQKYGGNQKIHKVVIEFYKRIQEEEQLDAYFEHMDWNRLINHQTNFIAHILGGPNRYTGETIEKVHQKMNIKAEDFDKVVSILKDTLVSFEFDSEDITTITNLLAGLKYKIVKSQKLAG